MIRLFPRRRIERDASRWTIFGAIPGARRPDAYDQYGAYDAIDDDPDTAA